jgi:hypothetical protein
LSKRRDVAAAKRFFSHATKQHGAPRVITLDGYAASHRAVAKLKEIGTLPRRVRVRSSKYLNNVVEQDHRRIKQRIRPMLGFKRFETATVTNTLARPNGGNGGKLWLVPKRDRPYTLKSFRVEQRHPFNAAGRSMSRSAAIWQSIRARTLH